MNPRATGTYTYQQIREALLSKQEIALVDVREEASFAQAHPLFAVNISLSNLELEIHSRIPRRSTTIVVYDNNEGLASKALNRLKEFGYTNVNLLDGDLNGWRKAGGELFKDVNVPSKAFGELVESKRHTPMLSASEVKDLIDANSDIIILDARKYDEYQTMNIPGSISVPGGELVLRARDLTPTPKTKIIVNCAGRTRSIIGTQSLINAEIHNDVVALRNGTIGWTLAGQQLENGASRHFTLTCHKNKEQEIINSTRLAERSGVKSITLKLLCQWLNENDRTTYCFDVRSLREYEEGHLPGFRSAPGGQLVQETDVFASVRGARIVLVDNDDCVRANMTGSWLSQMGWEVFVLDHSSKFNFTESGTEKVLLPSFPVVQKSNWINSHTLEKWFDQFNVVVVDFSKGAQYKKEHIPRAWYALRSQLSEAVEKLPTGEKYVLTSPDGTLACFVLPEFQDLIKGEVFILGGGTKSWSDSNRKLETDKNYFASEVLDRYQRPYEGTNNSAQAMEDYLEWEYGLVEQLDRDGTHGFFVI